MLRIRTAALSLTAAGAAALALGLSAAPAVAHGFDHHGFFGHHHHHALTGVVQNVDSVGARRPAAMSSATRCSQGFSFS